MNKDFIKNAYVTLISAARPSQKLIYDLATPIQKELLSFENYGYLKETGWIQSKISQEPSDASSNPVPWITYSAIEFLKAKLKTLTHLDVMEFGSGNSTLYFASLNYNIRSVEHNLEWYQKVKDKLKNFRNIDLQYQELEYGGAYSKIHDEALFDLVLVDGRDRVNCAINSYPHLKPSGILILDDSEREQYQKVLDFYTEKGFKRIDFWGIAPGIFYNKSTTILYRPDNIFFI